MSRPWVLTPIGQRVSMALGIVVAVLSLIPLGLQLQIEQNRKFVMQLDRTNVTFCELDKCGVLDQFQLIEPLSPAIATEGEFGTEVLVRVVNHGRLEGRREVWAILRSQEGKIIEGMKIWLELENSGPNQLQFFFTGSKKEFESGVLELGF